MARGFNFLTAAFLLLVLSLPVVSAQEDSGFVFRQHDNDSEENSFETAAAIPSPEDIEREKRMRELEERFKALSQSLGGMPAPPEVRNKKISFGDSSENER